jgi:hypothetical protein
MAALKERAAQKGLTGPSEDEAAGEPSDEKKA